MNPEHEYLNRVHFWISIPDRNISSVSHERVLGSLRGTGWTGKAVVTDDAATEDPLPRLVERATRDNNNARDGDFLWLIDQALAMDWISMAALVDETHTAGADYSVYSLEVGHPDISRDSPPGVACLKAGLARKILGDPNAIKSLMEQGLSAAVSALGEKVFVLEWCKHDNFCRFFRPGFPNCTVTEAVPGIHYPVFDPSTREAICSLNLDLANRLGGRILPYTGNKNRGWFVEDPERWMHWFGRTEASKALELGTTDGISTNAMLDLLFPDPGSEIHAVHHSAETVSPESTRELELFESNAAAGQHVGQIHLYTGQPVEVLAWMIAEDGYWESFDFIHFKPTGDDLRILTAVGQAWSLLKPGGIILLDSGMARIGETHPAKHVMETCVRIIGNQADLLLTGDLTALRKRPALSAAGDPSNAGLPV